MKHVLAILWKNRLNTAAYLVCGILCTFLEAYSPVMLQRVLDAFGGGTLSAALIWSYGAVLGAQYLLNYLDNAPDIRLENRVYLGFKLMALEKMRTVSFRACQALGAGGLIARIENGAQAGRGMLYSFWLRLLAWLVPGLIFSLVFIERIDPSIMLYIAAGYVAVFITSNLLLKYLYRVKAKILDNEELLNHYLVRGLMELSVFRTNRRYRAEIQRAEAAAAQVTGAKVAMRMIHEAFFTLFALLVLAIKVFILLTAMRGGALTVGSVVALLALIDQAYTPIAIGNVLYVQYRLDQSAFGRLKAFLDLPDDPRLVAGGAVTHAEGNIELRQVTVDYEGRLALSAVDMALRAGRSTALVGESGSGKSTVAKLVSGLLMPDGGSVRVGGQDMAEMALEDYFRHVCYCAQDAPVFNGTLRENLDFGEGIADDVLRAALGACELSALVAGLPSGLDSLIGERGALLSGGERQRLALARAMLSKAEIVVLDEATSALDNELERVVMGRLMEKMAGRTLIVIAHRLTSVAGVDELIAMRDGAVVERGTFESLMAKGGYFAQLWNAAQQGL